jgi:hypothetical protein
MLVFSGRPATPEDLQRYMRVCEAYLTVLNDSSDVERVDPFALQMITVWPRRDISAVRPFNSDASASATECQSAVAHYDYSAAYVWEKKFEARGAKLSVGRGPYLIAWAQHRRARKSVTVLTLDLSAMESTPQIENAFRLWANQIEGDPDSWQKSWQPQDWRFYTASMLDAYGQKVIDALAIVKHAGFLS